MTQKFIEKGYEVVQVEEKADEKAKKEKINKEYESQDKC